jgi:hypothetical protein
MKKGRAVFALVLILSLLASTQTLSIALSSTATQAEKVKLLSELSIFIGSNGDYRLNDKLSRSEAAALAVRMMGKELNVLLNSESYSNTPYPDVDPSHWYAAYVGFCTKEGILSGDTSGLYKPNEFITEKAFLKIILGVLGYEINKDYTWVDLFKKAFEVGLVTELSYIVKEDDNLDFKRGDAVNVMYNALTLEAIDTKMQLFHKLIDSGLLTKEKAIQLGLMQEETEENTEVNKDELPTEIDELLVFDETNLSIVFNEDIKSIEKIKIYETHNKKNLLKFNIGQIEENYILMTTDRQTPGMEYTIELQNIEDTEENIIENLYATFFGTASEKVESDFFRIQKIEPINERSVKLYFTHPVNLNAENSIYYTIKKDGYPFMYGEKDQLLARTINSEKYCVMLTLKSGTFTKGTRYSVEISGDMTSAYGVDMNDGYGDAMLFVAVDGQSQSFKLMDIAPYDNETIRLTFNKEVNMFLAQQIYNFYLTDQKNQPIPIKKVTVETQGDENGKVLYISMGETIKKDDKYYLTINNLNDATKQEYITEITYSFIAEYETTDRLSMIRITPIDVQTIDVYFSDMLDMETAVRSDYYNVTLRNGNASVYPQIVLYDRDIHPYKVTLFFNRGDLTERREYELRVSYELQDYLGTPAGETLKSRFNASPKQKENPSIEAVTPISSDAVLLSFTRELAFSQTNLSPENYTVEYNINGVNYRKAPLSVIYINSRTLVLKFDKLEYDIPYTLKFATLVDYSGDSFKVTGQGTNYVEFKLKEK